MFGQDRTLESQDTESECVATLSILPHSCSLCPCLDISVATGTYVAEHEEVLAGDQGRMQLSFKTASCTAWYGPRRKPQQK